jgi:hypothetical protein
MSIAAPLDTDITVASAVAEGRNQALRYSVVMLFKRARMTVPIRTAHENGHFYSPVVDPSEIREERIWPQIPPVVVGIDFDESGHEQILKTVFPRFMPEYDYPEILEETSDLSKFFTQNSQFSWLDCRTLFVLLREWQPRKIVEIGSGFTTLLFADVNSRFQGGAAEFICVEPYPRPFLKKGIPGVTQLLEQKVQDVPLEIFARLGAGDILFIDSSHVAKTGSDVVYLFSEILPRLEKGVRVHVHDIFLPRDYPRDWVITENRSWNEQYMLRALLTFSSAFRVTFGCSYAFWRFPDLVKAALSNPKGHAFGGGSFWFERI